MAELDSLPKGISVNEFQLLNVSSEFKGLFIRLAPDQEFSRESNQLIIEGACGLFISPGSAMAIWQSFPQSVIIHIRDIKKNISYSSSFEEMNISWEGEPDFGPTDQVVQNIFERDLFESNLFKGIDRLGQEITPGSSIEVYVTFEGMKSNTLRIKL